MYEEMTGVQAKQIVVLISVDGEMQPQVFVKNRRDYIPELANKIKEFRGIAP
jgi:hypothetical protein